MDYINKEDIRSLLNEGCESRQLLNDENSESRRVTITEVHLKPGYSQPRHIHDTSEQIWYALKGTGLLLLANNNEKKFSEGDVVRFSSGEVHGLLNDSDEEFVYISVTTPPINFRYAYKEEK